MSCIKGSKKTGGRKTGTPNKMTMVVKDAIIQAAMEAGGEGGMVGYLTTQATENPAQFMALLGKVMPVQIQGSPDGDPLVFKVFTGVPRADEIK